MDAFPYENWLHDSVNGARESTFDVLSPENWLRMALLMSEQSSKSSTEHASVPYDQYRFE
jgi:hypothetical protein